MFNNYIKRLFCIQHKRGGAIFNIYIGVQCVIMVHTSLSHTYLIWRSNNNTKLITKQCKHKFAEKENGLKKENEIKNMNVSSFDTSNLNLRRMKEGIFAICHYKIKD